MTYLGYIIIPCIIMYYMLCILCMLYINNNLIYNTIYFLAPLKCIVQWH